MDFEIGAEKEEVLEQYINHFWNARENVVPGKKEDYFFHLVDRKEDPVSTALLPNRESTARLEKPPDQEIRNARKIQSGG